MRRHLPLGVWSWEGPRSQQRNKVHSKDKKSVENVGRWTRKKEGRGKEGAEVEGESCKSSRTFNNMEVSHRHWLVQQLQRGGGA